VTSTRHASFDALPNDEPSDIPNINAQRKDPYKKYDDQQEGRNFEDPVGGPYCLADRIDARTSRSTFYIFT